MIPATAGLVAIIYNIPGLSAPLRLPRDLLAAIFTGEVAEWDDPRIAAANPGDGATGTHHRHRRPTGLRAVPPSRSPTI